jgi:SAM-dependent methyltransferase
MADRDDGGGVRDDVAAGQAVYSPLVLRMYDWFVLGFSNRLLWRCPSSELLRLYDRNVSSRHLDIGVGTGYFLDKAAWPTANPAITLVDLNENSLAFAADRIKRYAPRTVRANALEPLPLSLSPPQSQPQSPSPSRPETSAGAGAFDSCGMCFLLHCLPGTIAEKAVVFDHVRPFLAPGARVFGATILQGGAPRPRPAQALMNVYNKKGIFSNTSDRLEDLHAALTGRFTSVAVTMRGAVALFEAA